VVEPPGEGDDPVAVGASRRRVQVECQPPRLLEPPEPVAGERHLERREPLAMQAEADDEDVGVGLGRAGRLQGGARLPSAG
jgi:hypothetical protein